MPKKPTQKKKSGQRLPMSPAALEGLPIYDTVVGKMVGRVLEERYDCIVLECAGILNIRYEPADNGKKVTAKVAILNPTFVGEKYYLMRAGIRGMTYRYDKWLFDLHKAYAEQVRSGKYELDLCVPPVEASVQLRAEPDDQAPEQAVALVSAEDTKAIPNA